MSVRLYAGFELEGLTLEAALPVLRALREKTLKEAYRQSAAFILRTAVAAYDRAALGLPADSVNVDRSSFLFDAAQVMQARQDEVVRTSRRDSAVDTSLTVTLIPVQGRLLGIYFGDNVGVLDVLRAHPAYRELPYWDGSEQPEGMSEEDWAARRSLWQAALPGWGAPGEFGVTYDLVPDWTYLAGYPEVARALETLPMPALADRARGAAEALLDAGQLEGVSPPTRMSEVGRWLRSPEWAAVCDGVRLRLQPTLTLDDLRKRSPS